MICSSSQVIRYLNNKLIKIGRAIELLNPTDKDFENMLKTRPKEVNNIIITSVGMESIICTKLSTIATLLKTDVLPKLKDLFAETAKTFKQLLDSCKTMEKKMSISYTNVEAAFALYMHLFYDHEKEFTKGILTTEDLWLRENAYYNAVR